MTISFKTNDFGEVKINKVTASQDDDSLGELTEGRPLCGSRGTPQIPRLRSPGFLLRFVALMDFMRLSLRKGAHAALSILGAGSGSG